MPFVNQRNYILMVLNPKTKNIDVQIHIKDDTRNNVEQFIEALEKSKAHFENAIAKMDAKLAELKNSIVETNIDKDGKPILN